ncbi:MAG: hypothetical protein QW117_01985 [Candidatus Pacearchaeota archaeon]
MINKKEIFEILNRIVQKENNKFRNLSKIIKSEYVIKKEKNNIDLYKDYFIELRNKKIKFFYKKPISLKEYPNNNVDIEVFSEKYIEMASILKYLININYGFDKARIKKEYNRGKNLLEIK